jgi:ABC-type multidrug transport system fused ATPase/permease subunit
MQNPYLSLLKTAWKNTGEQKNRFILIYTLFVLANLVVAINPLFYGWFVSEIQEHGTAVINHAWIYVCGFLGLRLLEWALHGPARVMERKLAFSVSKNFMEDLYNKVLFLPVGWHDENHSGSTINKLRKAHEALRDFFQNGFVYLYSIGKFTFSFGAMLYFSPLFGTIGVVLGFVTVLIIIQFDKPYIRSLQEVNRKEHEVSSVLFDSLSNIRTVITLKLERQIHAGLMSKIAAVFIPFRKNVTINEWKWFTAQMMVGIIYCVTVFGYIYQNWQPGTIFQIGGLIILIGYVNQFTSVFNDIAAQYTQVTRYYTEVQNANELESAFERAHRTELLTTLPADWDHIQIDKLNFSRKDTDKQLVNSGIRNMSMSITKGSRIAVIGESGSGKSTLLSLLRGLHSPENGAQVTINHNTISDVQHIANAITLFPQEPEIFDHTILYNITLGQRFSEDEVMQACEEAHFAEVVRALPNGLHTHIQEKGVNLSGGQKQRLALVRGILASKTSDIILLDEPTSSVDPRTEKMIYLKLFNAFQDRAIISSLHRMHLLSLFTYIYIMKDGAVIAEGTFDELYRYSLVFKEMWDDQNTGHSTEFSEMNVAL